MQHNYNITILLNTCDAYSDVLKLFFAALNEYWPNNYYKIVINSEKNIYDDYNVITHTCSLNYCTWGKRLKSTLQSIETEYVLMLFDDFILEDFVRVVDIISAENLLSTNKEISVVYLVNTKLPLKEPDDQNQFIELSSNCDFRLNSFPGLWRREHLVSYTGINDNPWAWELFGSFRTFQNNRPFYSLNPKFSNIFPYNYERGGGIYRGKWVREVVEHKISKYSLDINTSIRGYSDTLVYQPRTLIWKLNFFIIGYKMIGVKVFEVIFRMIKSKYIAKKTN
jgi:hypothetical protein